MRYHKYKNIECFSSSEQELLPRPGKMHAQERVTINWTQKMHLHSGKGLHPTFFSGIPRIGEAGPAGRSVVTRTAERSAGRLQWSILAVSGTMGPLGAIKSFPTTWIMATYGNIWQHMATINVQKCLVRFWLDPVSWCYLVVWNLRDYVPSWLLGLKPPIRCWPVFSEWLRSLLGKSSCISKFMLVKSAWFSGNSRQDEPAY